MSVVHYLNDSYVIFITPDYIGIGSIDGQILVEERTEMNGGNLKYFYHNE